MSAMTLSFDFAGMAIDKIHDVERADKHAAKKVAFTKQASTMVPVFMSAWIGRMFAGYIDRKAQSLAENAIFLEGAAYRLTEQIAETFLLPGTELVSALDAFKPKLSEAIISCEQAVKFFQARSLESPAAVAFQKVVLALRQVSSAAVLLRAVATGSSVSGVLMPYTGVASWEEAVAQQRHAFNEVRARISGGDTSDIDAELLEMAAQAITASDSRDIRQDPAWIDRMSRSTMH